MDPKEFKQRLKEFAELVQIKPAKTPAIKEPIESDSIWRDGEEIVIDKDNNETLNWAVKKLHDRTEACPDCDLIVINRTVHYKVCTHPFDHWRASCKNCRKTQCPETGRFTLSSIAAGNIYTNHLKQNRSKSMVLFKKPTK
jgi:hypothetical protein